MKEYQDGMDKGNKCKLNKNAKRNGNPSKGAKKVEKVEAEERNTTGKMILQ